MLNYKFSVAFCLENTYFSFKLDKEALKKFLNCEFGLFIFKKTVIKNKCLKQSDKIDVS